MRVLVYPWARYLANGIKNQLIYLRLFSAWCTEQNKEHNILSISSVKKSQNIYCIFKYLKPELQLKEYIILTYVQNNKEII